MASMFGDQSYSKLPPIRKGSLKDAQEIQEEKENNSSHVIDFNREGHGLVRLPPIIRVDSSLNTTRQRKIKTRRGEILRETLIRRIKRRSSVRDFQASCLQNINFIHHILISSKQDEQMKTEN